MVHHQQQNNNHRENPGDLIFKYILTINSCLTVTAQLNLLTVTPDSSVRNSVRLGRARVKFLIGQGNFLHFLDVQLQFSITNNKLCGLGEALLSDVRKSGPNKSCWTQSRKYQAECLVG